MPTPGTVSMHHSGNEQWAVRELERRASLHQQQEQHALLQLQQQQQDLLRQQQHVQAMHQQQQQLQTIHERLLLREQLLASLAGNSDRLNQLDAAASDGQRAAAEGLWHHKQPDVANRPAPPLLPDMFQPEKLVRVCTRSSSSHQFADASRNPDGRDGQHAQQALGDTSAGSFGVEGVHSERCSPAAPGLHAQRSSLTQAQHRPARYSSLKGGRGLTRNVPRGPLRVAFTGDVKDSRAEPDLPAKPAAQPPLTVPRTAPGLLFRAKSESGRRELSLLRSQPLSQRKAKQAKEPESLPLIAPLLNKGWEPLADRVANLTLTKQPSLSQAKTWSGMADTGMLASVQAKARKQREERFYVIEASPAWGRPGGGGESVSGSSRHHKPDVADMEQNDPL